MTEQNPHQASLLSGKPILYPPNQRFTQHLTEFQTEERDTGLVIIIQADDEFFRECYEWNTDISLELAVGPYNDGEIGIYSHDTKEWIQISHGAGAEHCVETILEHGQVCVEISFTESNIEQSSDTENPKIHHRQKISVSDEATQEAFKKLVEGHIYA